MTAVITGAAAGAASGAVKGAAESGNIAAGLEPASAQSDSNKSHNQEGSEGERGAT